MNRLSVSEFLFGMMIGGWGCPFGTWFLWHDGRYRRVDGRGGWGRRGEDCESGTSRVFCLFTALLFGGYDGCESGDISCGWCGGVRWCSGVGVVEVVCDVRMGVGVGGVTNRGQGVVSSGRNVTVADGGGARWRDCCRIPNGIFGELWEDLPYCLPFTLSIGDVFM